MSSSQNPEKSSEKPSLRDTIEMLSSLLESESIPATIRLTDKLEEPFEIKKGPLRFHFTTMGFIFTARADLQTNSGYLRITGDLGILPYSAQSPFLRRCLLTIIQQGKLMRHCRLQIRGKSRIIVAGVIRFEGTQNRSVLTALVRLLIDCRPHLSLFREYLEFLPNLLDSKPVTTQQ